MLEKLEEEHLDMILAWRNRPEVRKNMYSTGIISAEEHRAWFARQNALASSRSLVFSADGDSLGVLYFTSWNQTSRHAFWGFYVAPDAPIQTSLQLEFEALEYAFETLNLHKLSCEVIAFNQSVINLHKKSGFLPEGEFVDFHYDEGQYHNVVRLSLLEGQWPQSRDKLSRRLIKFSGGQ